MKTRSSPAVTQSRVDSPSHGVIPCSSQFLCCCWPSLWKCWTPWCANRSWCPCVLVGWCSPGRKTLQPRTESSQADFRGLGAIEVGRLQKVEWASRRPCDLDELASVFGDLHAEISEHTLNTVLESKAFNDAEERYVQFCQSLSPNGQLWSSYLDIVGLLLQFTRSTREANWNLHVECLLELLPWFCACLLYTSDAADE